MAGFEPAGWWPFKTTARLNVGQWQFQDQKARRGVSISNQRRRKDGLKGISHICIFFLKIFSTSPSFITRGASRLAVLHLSFSRMFTPHTQHRRLGRRGNFSAHRKATWDEIQSISPKLIYIHHWWPDVAADMARPPAPKMAGIPAITATTNINGSSSSCQPKPCMGGGK